MPPQRLRPHWRLILSLVLRALPGLTPDRKSGVLRATFYPIRDFVGKPFLNALKTLIVPLAVYPIAVGVTGAGPDRHHSR